MKRMIVCAAALSFALVACTEDCCGDESSSGADRKIINQANCVHRGNCDGSYRSCTTVKIAFLLQSEEGGYQVLLRGIQSTLLRISGDYYSKRSGDTLRVWDEIKESDDINLWCPADVKFDISAEEADIKYFMHYSDVYKVLPADSIETTPYCLEESN